jgi:hypothetical protein
MKKMLLLAVILFFSHAVYAQNGNEAGFNEICEVYTAALNSHMNIEKMSDYIFSSIAQRVKSKDALNAHEAVMQLDASQRYKIFRQSAELSLKHNWNCPAMKEVMAMKRDGSKTGAEKNR